MDAGGESYAQPDPFLTSLAADAVTNLFQWRATNGLLPYPHVWSKEDNWRQAPRRASNPAAPRPAPTRARTRAGALRPRSHPRWPSPPTQALRAYLKSGGYQERVNPELIRTVMPPALVLWGEDDDVLPVEDAYK